MTRKLFILAIVLIAVNYFYGAQIEAWWQGWRSGDRIQEISQNVADDVLSGITDEIKNYSADEIKGLATSLPKDIQLQIDNWLLAQNLNEYGDPDGTMYTGGTPAFDEATGETLDRFELIFGKFPELIDKFKLSIEEIKDTVDQAATE